MYGLVALVAVVGIFAIGLWLGDQMSAPETTQTTAAAPTVVGSAPIAGGAVDNSVPVATVPVADAQAGAAPVSVESVAVEEGQPRLWIEEVAATNWQYDFGSILATDKVEHDFEVTNVGSGVLEIQDASASCGCTAAVVSDTTVEPGGTSQIRVSYDPRVNQEFGKFVTKQIRIKSNDPLVPLAEFTITADVQAQ
jgi:hypothetical protein